MEFKHEMAKLKHFDYHGLWQRLQTAHNHLFFTKGKK